VSWLPGAHPVPDARSLRAADEMLALVAGAPRDALILALVSGGASAMVAKPRPGATLEHKVAAIARRMAEGASIAELNAARRALSAVKGGQLVAQAACPVLSLLVSDVAGDDPRVVGSGLTISAAARPLQRAARPAERAPGAARHRDDRSDDQAAAGDVRNADRFEVVAGQGAVAAAAAQRLRADGVTVVQRDEPLVGDVGAAAAWLARWARHGSGVGPRALVAFGEPVVRLPASPGVGGRAQQLALLLARELAGAPVTALIAGTDGVDGVGTPPAAGGVVDGATWGALAARGLDGDAALARCDARAALAAVDALLVTGPTGRNHADVMLLLCDDPDG
jgi:glycerate 2-kinase